MRVQVEHSNLAHQRHSKRSAKQKWRTEVNLKVRQTTIVTSGVLTGLKSSAVINYDEFLSSTTARVLEHEDPGPGPGRS